MGLYGLPPRQRHNARPSGTQHKEDAQPGRLCSDGSSSKCDRGPSYGVGSPFYRVAASLCPKVVALYSKWAAGATALQLVSFNFPCGIELRVLLFRAGWENGNVTGCPWVVGRMNTTKGHMPISIPEVLVIFTEPARPPLLARIHNTSFYQLPPLFPPSGFHGRRFPIQRT